LLTRCHSLYLYGGCLWAVDRRQGNEEKRQPVASDREEPV